MLTRAALAFAAVLVATTPLFLQAQSAIDAVTAPGLPAIGKWMVAHDGAPAHWLGEPYRGRRLREPINVVFVDAGAADAEHARQRLVAASTAAGYPIRFGHSAGYRGFVDDRFYPQLPGGRDDAFSNGIFELANNHGRIFGAHAFGDAFVSVAAFSREDIDVFRWPMHGYASFAKAREDFADSLQRAGVFKRAGYVDLENALQTPSVTTGDHDGRAVLMRAGR